ncbi:MAG: leucine-rich repeat domain-containing protein [Clostridia bacterium]|nr:leucine-rich repeat domain-containing protein [Clostridia bacterium]
MERFDRNMEMSCNNGCDCNGTTVAQKTATAKKVLCFALILVSLVVYAVAGAAVSNDFDYIVDDSGYAIITAYLGSDSSVEIPDVLDGYTVDSIADLAFANMDFITSPVRVPIGVIVEADAFQGSDCGFVYYGESNGFLYELSNGITITGYTHTGGNLIIPQKINGYNVTTIGEGAFEGRIDLLSLSVPATLTAVKDRAFKGCSNLTGNFDFVKQLQYVGAYAFYDCEKLTGTAEIATESWGEHSFQNSGISGYTNSNDFIPAYAFAGCKELKQDVYATPSVYATEIDQTGNGLYCIGEHAFDGSAVTDLYCSVEYNYTAYASNYLEIGAYAFANTTMKEVVINIQEMVFATHIFDGSHINRLWLRCEGAYVANANQFYGATINDITIGAESIDFYKDGFNHCSFDTLSASAQPYIMPYLDLTPVSIQQGAILKNKTTKKKTGKRPSIPCCIRD